MRFIRYIIATIILTAPALSILAQVKISGKVIDADNEPIEFATVRVEGTAIGVTTDLKSE